MSKQISEPGGKAFAVLLISLLLPLLSSASTLQADSSQIFRLNDFYVQILRFHPVARQAGLLDDKARQTCRKRPFYGKKLKRSIAIKQALRIALL